MSRVRRESSSEPPYVIPNDLKFGSTGAVNIIYKGESYRLTKQLSDLFDHYAEDNKEVISIDGVISYMEDLGLEPEDMIALCVSKYVGCSVMGEFKRTPFLLAWCTNGVTSIEEMRSMVDIWRDSLKNDDSYRQAIYEYSFALNLNVGQKGIAKDVAIEIWKMFFTGERLESWFGFVEKVYDRELVSRDSWNMFYSFYKEIEGKSDEEVKREWDENASWPVMFDEYVETL